MGAGDLNGDCFDDLLAGAPGEGSAVGDGGILLARTGSSTGLGGGSGGGGRQGGYLAGEDEAGDWTGGGSNGGNPPPSHPNPGGSEVRNDIAPPAGGQPTPECKKPLPSGGGPGSGPGPAAMDKSHPAPADKPAPVLGALRLTATRLYRGGRRSPRSIYLRFTLSAPGRVSLSVMRRQRGIRLWTRMRSDAGRSRLVRRCVGPTRRNRRRLARQLKRRLAGERARHRAIRRSRCRRWVRKAQLVHAGREGTNRVRISARIGKRRLPRGTYRIHGRATGVAGSKSNLVRSNPFRVVR